jgi:uncharacterized protein (DUF427 family)
MWNDAVLAESDETVIVEGNHYFPPASVKREYFNQSDSHTQCHWKGEASYYTVAVEGKENPDAAWYYADPFDAAAEIRDYVAFWHGVTVVADDGDGRRGPQPPGRS